MLLHPELIAFALVPLPVQARFYQGGEKQYRFFKRMGDAFVRVGLLESNDSMNAQYSLGGSLILPSPDVSCGWYGYTLGNALFLEPIGPAHVCILQCMLCMLCKARSLLDS